MHELYNNGAHTRLEHYFGFNHEGSLYKDDEFREAVYPTVEKPIRALISLAGVQVDFDLGITVDCRPVEPGESQRGSDWHIDGSPYTIVVSDRLPTQFLVGSIYIGIGLIGEGRKAYRAISGDTPVYKLNYIPDEHLSNLVLRVFTPEPNRFVQFPSDRTIHRSQENTSDEIIERAWIRFSP